MPADPTQAILSHVNAPAAHPRLLDECHVLDQGRHHAAAPAEVDESSSFRLRLPSLIRPQLEEGEAAIELGSGRRPQGAPAAFKLSVLAPRIVEAPMREAFQIGQLVRITRPAPRVCGSPHLLHRLPGVEGRRIRGLSGQEHGGCRAPRQGRRDRAGRPHGCTLGSSSRTLSWTLPEIGLRRPY